MSLHILDAHMYRAQEKPFSGAPNRGEEPDNLIIDLATRLDAGRFPLTQLGIQFIQ